MKPIALHAPQKCYCVSPRAFFPGVSGISISVVMATQRQGRKNWTLTSGFWRLPDHIERTAEFIKEHQKNTPFCLTLSFVYKSTLWKGLTTTLRYHLSSTVIIVGITEHTRKNTPLLIIYILGNLCARRMYKVNLYQHKVCIIEKWALWKLLLWSVYSKFWLQSV